MKDTSLNATLLPCGTFGQAGALRVGAPVTVWMRASAPLASIMPDEANMIRASAVERMAEKTA